MISYTELQTRLARFVDAEMLPHMTGGKRILLGGYAALATKNAAGTSRAFSTSRIFCVLSAPHAASKEIEHTFWSRCTQ